MNETPDFGTEPVCSPDFVRCETVFRPAPGYEFLATTPAGETTPSKSAPLAKLPFRNPTDALHFLVARTGMAAGAQMPKSLRELLMLMKGMFIGLIPEGRGHSSPEEDEFEAYLQERFRQPGTTHWNNILLNAFSNLSYDDAHDALIQVVRDWMASRSAPKSTP